MSLRNYLEALLGLLYPTERSCLSCRGPLPEADTARGRKGTQGRPDRNARSQVRTDLSSSPQRQGVQGWGVNLQTKQSWLEEKGLCARCRSDLTPIESPYCLLCGRHITEPGRCPECERRTSFVLSRSYGKYEGVLRDLLHRFKFSREEELLSVLGPCINKAWDLHLAHFPIDLLIPVTVHAERLKERGYNQAERLTLQLSSYSNIPWLPVLQRNLHLKGQATRNRKERLKALQGTYACDPIYRDRVFGKRILLVDDIYTTGSTAEACAQVLLDAGGVQVYVITVAR